MPGWRARKPATPFEVDIMANNELTSAEDPFVRDAVGSCRYDESSWAYRRRIGLRLWHIGTYVYVVKSLASVYAITKVQYLDSDPGVMVVLLPDGKTEIVSAFDVYATNEEAKERCG